MIFILQQCDSSTASSRGDSPFRKIPKRFFGRHRRSETPSSQKRDKSQGQIPPYRAFHPSKYFLADESSKIALKSLRKHLVGPGSLNWL
ncbi:hypothetical protein AVEN_172188-1, partial [Araneus ventricosus]